MSNKNKIYAGVLFVILFPFKAISLKAQETGSAELKKAGEYSLVLYTGGGLSYYTPQPGVPENIETKTNLFGICSTFRLMWQPDHLLRVGIETGKIPFYSYTIRDNNYSGELKLSAIPVLLVWSMPITKKFNVFIGYGYYLLKSKLDYAGKTNSSAWSIGWNAAASYIHPVSENVGIAGELKWMESSNAKNTVLIFQLQLAWKFLKW